MCKPSIYFPSSRLVKNGESVFEAEHTPCISYAPLISISQPPFILRACVESREIAAGVAFKQPKMLPECSTPVISYRKSDEEKMSGK